MIRINVGPQQKIPDFRLDFLVAVAVLLGAWGFAYELPGFYADYKIEEAGKLLEQTNQDRAKLSALKVEVKQVELLRARLSQKKARQAAILSLSEGRKQVVLAFDELQKIHPDRMWFTSLAVRGSEATLQGFAADHGVVSDYALRLREVDGTALADVVDLKSFEPEFSDLPETPGVAEIDVRPDVTPVKFSHVALSYSNNIALGKSAADLKLPSFSLKFQYR